MNHAKGKRWTKDKAEKKKGPEDGKGLCRGPETALPNSGGCRSSGSGLCLSRSKKEKERFSKTMDQPDQCGGKASWAFLQSSHGCLEEGPRGVGPEDLGRPGGDRSRRLLQDRGDGQDQYGCSKVEHQGSSSIPARLDTQTGQEHSRFGLNGASIGVFCDRGTGKASGRDARFSLRRRRRRKRSLRFGSGVLGRKGSLTQLLKSLGALPEADRREIG